MNSTYIEDLKKIINTEHNDPYVDLFQNLLMLGDLGFLTNGIWGG